MQALVKRFEEYVLSNGETGSGFWCVRVVVNMIIYFLAFNHVSVLFKNHGRPFTIPNYSSLVSHAKTNTVPSRNN